MNIKLLNKEQRFTYKVLMQGYNVFLTGGAGVGKTYVINCFVEQSRYIGKNVMLCAPTGIAALNIGGVTLHRQFRAPLGVILDYKYTRNEELIRTDILIIDEISMCRIDLFDFICKNIADANSVRKSLGFKNIQIIMVGDFFQLPPVMREYEQRVLSTYYGYDIGVGFAFNSIYWNMLELNTIVLTESIRQQDEYFVNNLNNIRIGNKAYIDNIYKNSCKQYIDNAITLCGKNKEAQEINTNNLHKIDEQSMNYKAIISGDVVETDTLAEINLELRTGARIMTLINNKDTYANGMFGTVQGLYDGSIIVQMDNGIIVEMERFHWDIKRYELEETQEHDFVIKEVNVGYIEQFPVKLAYAITIHKSQGQTYDKMNILPYCWDCGQLYVAISRCKKLENIHFKYEPDIKYLVISLNVIKFHNSLKILEIQDVDDNEILALKNKVETQKQSFGNELDNLLNMLNNI